MHLGVKAHWRDADAMVDVAREAGARTLEVHLAPRDVDADRARVLDAFRPLARDFRLVVHQPEFTVNAAGERVFTDPSAPDWPAAAHAVDALARAAHLARELGAAGLVVHPGGVTLTAGDRPGSAAALHDVLQAVRVEATGVPLWLENMPWFYGWEGAASGRVGRCTLGRHPDEYAPLADAVDGFCLDFCHAFLAAPPPDAGWARVDAFLDAWGDRVRHAHASGAVAVPVGEGNPRAGEGVPFTEGDMDASGYARRLARLPGSVAVVPEVEDGFREDAKGFREALAWLKGLPAGAGT